MNKNRKHPPDVAINTPACQEYVPWINLAGAILHLAKEDYIWALTFCVYIECERLEEFFLSDYGQLLSFHQGEYIIQHCKAIAFQRRRRE